MKFKQLVLLSVTSLFASALSISGSTVGVLANPSSNNVPSVRTSTETQATMVQNPMLISGSFVAAEAPTTGKVRIVTENGHRFLQIDSAFSTSDKGPDLHVILDTAAKPPQAYQNPGSYVNLGKLQKYKGSQRYPIPDMINLSEFKSVAIWCRMANATFGYATLGGTNSARN